MSKCCFDYGKLRNRITKRLGTEKELADRLGISLTQLSRKLTNKTRFSTDNIMDIVAILDIPIDKISLYFFDQEV